MGSDHKRNRMAMKQTAMQQHIEWLKATLEICKEHAPTLVNCISLCISDAKSRLKVEADQRQEDTNHGYSQGYDDGAGGKEPMRPEMFESQSYQQKMRDKINYYKKTFKSE